MRALVPLDTMDGVSSTTASRTRVDHPPSVYLAPLGPPKTATKSPSSTRSASEVDASRSHAMLRGGGAGSGSDTWTLAAPSGGGEARGGTRDVRVAAVGEHPSASEPRMTKSERTWR